jgi:hypothetical protein
MAIIASTASKTYELPPEGVINAVLVDVVDLGDVVTTWGTKRQVRLHWEVDAQDSQGDTITVASKYNLSLAGEPKPSNLRRDLKAWRGRDLTPEELRGFDLESMLGQACRLYIQHSEPNAEGKVFANFTKITPPLKGSTPMQPSGNYVRKIDRAPREDAPASPAKPAPLPRTAQSQGRPAQSARPVPAPPVSEFDDDQVPF